MVFHQGTGMFATTPPSNLEDDIGHAYGTRTHIFALRGRLPDQLEEGAIYEVDLGIADQHFNRSSPKSN